MFIWMGHCVVFFMTKTSVLDWEYRDDLILFYKEERENWFLLYTSQSVCLKIGVQMIFSLIYLPRRLQEILMTFLNMKMTIELLISKYSGRFVEAFENKLV